MDSTTTKDNGLLQLSSWAYLPEDILHLIMASLTNAEFIRFGSVCKSWYSLFKTTRTHLLPMMFIPFQQNMVLFSFFENKYYTNTFDSPNNIISCLSCPYDFWAIIGTNSTITLLNPLAQIKNIHLPPLQKQKQKKKTKIYLCDITKVVLSCNPWVDQDNYMVAFMGIGFVRCIRAGQKLWSPVVNLTSDYYIMDILFYQDQLFVLCDDSNLLVYAFTSSRIKKVYDVLLPISCKSPHFVESLQLGLLLIDRRCQYDFKIYGIKVENSGIYFRHSGMGKDDALFFDEQNRNCRCILGSKYWNCGAGCVYSVVYFENCCGEADYMVVDNQHSTTYECPKQVDMVDNFDRVDIDVIDTIGAFGPYVTDWIQC